MVLRIESYLNSYKASALFTHCPTVLISLRGILGLESDTIKCDLVYDIKKSKIYKKEG